jgi:hypothetical protein
MGALAKLRSGKVPRPMNREARRAVFRASPQTRLSELRLRLARRRRPKRAASRPRERRSTVSRTRRATRAGPSRLDDPDLAETVSEAGVSLPPEVLLIQLRCGLAHLKFITGNGGAGHGCK